MDLLDVFHYILQPLAVRDRAGQELARGLANYSSAETRLIARRPSTQIESALGYVNEPELIHRTNLVVRLDTTERPRA